MNYEELAKNHPDELVRLFNEDRKTFDQLAEANGKTLLQRLEAENPEFLNSIDERTRQEIINNHLKHQR